MTAKPLDLAHAREIGYEAGGLAAGGYLLEACDEIERLERERDEGWEAFRELRARYAAEKYPGMTAAVRPADETVVAPDACPYCGGLRAPNSSCLHKGAAAKTDAAQCDHRWHRESFEQGMGYCNDIYRCRRCLETKRVPTTAAPG